MEKREQSFSDSVIRTLNILLLVSELIFMEFQFKQLKSKSSFLKTVFAESISHNFSFAWIFLLENTTSLFYIS